MPDYFVELIYFISALLFVFGFKKISMPDINKNGVLWIVGGGVLAIIATFLHTSLDNNISLILISMLVGGLLSGVLIKVMSLTNIPKMTAVFGGFGAFGLVSIMVLQLVKVGTLSESDRAFAMLSMVIGSVALTGYLTVFAKAQGFVAERITFPMQHWLNALILVVTLTFGVSIILNGEMFELSHLTIFLALSLLLGVLFILPSQQVDITMIVSLLNALTGLALGLAACVFENWPMLIVGSLVASAGLVMSLLTSTLTNRSLSHALLSENESASDSYDFDHIINEPITVAKKTSVSDVSMMMTFAKRVIIVPGYGMALSQAQDSLWELTKLLSSKGVNVKVALHPMAGRMTGHMGVLLAETGISYDSLFDLEDINSAFESADVVLLVGANDIVNPRARDDESYTLYGVPILNADKAKNVIVLKRGDGVGYSQSENPLFHRSNTSMLYGDADTILSQVIRTIKAG